MLANRSEGQSFTAYAVSGSGKRVYVWGDRGSRVSKRSCRHGSVERLDTEGCDRPGW